MGTTDEYYGVTILAGAGLSYYFNPNISADLTLMIHTGQFTKYYLTTNYDTITKKNQINSDVFNLNGLLGVQYHFSKSRVTDNGTQRPERIDGFTDS
ncbi:MAG: hypothetical protein IPP15_04895 [Saprospiraceae bacterium]|uniref:Outer membrane protein beta-barrel domain-containing protein n=1 Tax=Candidatus Opimibacter skivensis TaxID=2982028 RepID=A0A9D7SR57_9BACT|nr:hypothetical protein [Candidatus Opimibacter skivensis]